MNKEWGREEMGGMKETNGSERKKYERQEA